MKYKAAMGLYKFKSDNLESQLAAAQAENRHLNDVIALNNDTLDKIVGLKDLVLKEAHAEIAALKDNLKTAVEALKRLLEYENGADDLSHARQVLETIHADAKDGE